MNSFQSIPISRNTSLAIVAPGIAEALFATALGLLAAIPAVIAYNKFNSDSKKYSGRIENFSFLATVGATAPFIGLFGTVWGIMNSFQSIAISRNTSLAIVAPGIAEALFATALGLLAAIPAVMAYNKFNNESRIYGRRIENFTKRFLSII